MVFIFQFVYMMDYIDRLLYVEPSLHLWDEADLIMVDNGSDMFLYLVCILLSIFASMFMRDCSVILFLRNVDCVSA